MDRRHQFKKTFDAHEVRLRGAESQLEMRKQQRRELMNAKRTQTLERLAEGPGECDSSGNSNNAAAFGASPAKPQPQACSEKHPVLVLRHLEGLRGQGSEAELNACLKLLTGNGYISELNAHLQEALSQSLADDGNDSNSESSTEAPGSEPSKRSPRQPSERFSPVATVRAALAVCNLLSVRHAPSLLQLRGSTKAVQLADVLLGMMNFPVTRDPSVLKTLLEVLGNACADLDAVCRARLMEKNLFAFVRQLLEVLCSGDKPAEWGEQDAVDIASMGLWILRNCVASSTTDSCVLEATRVFTGMLHLARDSNSQIVEEAVQGLCVVVERQGGRFIRSVLIEGQAGNVRTHLDCFRENVTVNILVELCSGAHIERISRDSTGTSFDSRAEKLAHARQNRAAAFDFVRKVLKTSQLPGAEDGVGGAPGAGGSSSSTSAPVVPSKRNPLHKQVAQLLLSADLFPAVCSFLKATVTSSMGEDSRSVLPDVIDCLDILTLLIAESDRVTEITPILRQGIFLLLRSVGAKFVHNQKFMTALLGCYSRFFLQIQELFSMEKTTTSAAANWRTLFSICLDREGKKNVGEVRGNAGPVFGSSVYGNVNVNADFVGICFDFFAFASQFVSNVVAGGDEHLWIRHAKVLNEVVLVALFVRKSTCFPVMNAHNGGCAMLKEAADLINDNRACLRLLQESIRDGKLHFPVESVVFRTGHLVSLGELQGGSGAEYLEKGIAQADLDRFLLALFNKYLHGAFDVAHTYAAPDPKGKGDASGGKNSRYRTLAPLREMHKPLCAYVKMFVESDEDDELLSSCGDEDYFGTSGIVEEDDEPRSGSPRSRAFGFEDSISFEEERSRRLERTVGVQGVGGGGESQSTIASLGGPGDSGNFAGFAVLGQQATSNPSMVANRVQGHAMVDSCPSSPRQQPRPSEMAAMRRFFCHDQLQPFGAGAKQGGFDFS